MGRPPTNGGPSFRFSSVEVGEMDSILQAHNNQVPSREILDALAHRFSISTERAGKVEVSGKQVWNWFQNRRYAIRAKATRTSEQAPVNGQTIVRTVAQAPIPQPQPPPQYRPPQPQPPPSTTLRSMPHVPIPVHAPSTAQSAGRNFPENLQMEFEAKSARDGAWYDVVSFLSYRSLETGEPDALVRFAGFGPEEDEWVNIRKHVRQRSLPCESSECVIVLPGDLILCFQEGKEQALYYDAHVLDSQRRRHDVRGCRCRFLVRYDHDESEEIVPLRKICRRPETDFRLQQLHSVPVNVNSTKARIDSQVGNTLKVDASSGPTTVKQPKPEERVESGSMTTTQATTFPTNVKVGSESNLLTPKTVDNAGNLNVSQVAIVHAAGSNPTMQQG
ncbi:hypothetical protein CASFOL_019194 [Castilleja foliolosa]|uniref:Homeobox domain-containing protein n=1 Tax=Castilleja foliolosa TaxID=1961234 RepID=A0ABD3D7I3_9LAMI